MNSPTYTRDLLARTAAVSTSLVDLMRKVGAPLGSGPRCYLNKRLKQYGIDTSHFHEEALPERARRSYSKDLLADAAARSHSIREMIEYMGFPRATARTGTFGKSSINSASTPRTSSAGADAGLESCHVTSSRPL